MINIWFIFIAAEVYRNWYMIEKKKSKPIYLQSFIIRGMAAILHGILMDVKDMREWVPVLLFQLCSFWVLFDLFLNIARRKSVLHIGSSNWIDKYVGQISELYWVLKTISVIVAVVLYLALTL